MDTLTLKQLRYFCALAELKQFSKAADHCAVSQAALSIQMKQLEESLGLALLERSPKSVSLTSHGRAFLEKAKGVLAGVDDIKDWQNASSTQPMGELRLGIIPTIAPYFLPQALKALHQAGLSTSFHVRETITQRLVSDLLEARLDLAILALPLDEARLETMALFDEELVLARPLSEAQAPKPSLETLTDMRLLLLEEGNCLRDNALTFCELNQVALQGMLEGSTLATLTKLVQAGMGVTLLPLMAVEEEAGGLDVHISRFSEPAPFRTVGLAWRKRSPLEQEYRALAKVLIDTNPSNQFA